MCTRMGITSFKASYHALWAYTLSARSSWHWLSDFYKELQLALIWEIFIYAASNVCSAKIHSCFYWPSRYPKLWLLMLLLPKTTWSKNLLYVIPCSTSRCGWNLEAPKFQFVPGQKQPVTSCHMTQVVGCLVAVIHGAQCCRVGHNLRPRG